MIVERTIVSQAYTGTVSRATFGKHLRDGVERIYIYIYEFLLAHIYHLKVN